MKRVTIDFALFAAMLGVILPAMPAKCDSFGSGANAFDIEFVPIGNSGNIADTTGTPDVAGSVSYDYRIGKFEISRDMINKAEASGSLGIALFDMSAYGGNQPNKPAAGINWLEAAKFVNWLNTSTGHSPAYKFDSSGFNLWQSTDAGFDPNNMFRNSLAYYFLPSSDEWYKAAYYDPNSETYFDYATGSNDTPVPILSGTAPGTAVYIGSNPNTEVYQQLKGPAEVNQAGGLSPYGTMGQSGNILEWEETDGYFLNDSTLHGHGVRGGFWIGTEYDLRATYRDLADPDFDFVMGFRVASVVPEPSTILIAAIVATISVLRSRQRRTRTFRVS